MIVYNGRASCSVIRILTRAASIFQRLKSGLCKEAAQVSQNLCDGTTRLYQYHMWLEIKKAGLGSSNPGNVLSTHWIIA